MKALVISKVSDMKNITETKVNKRKITIILSIQAHFKSIKIRYN